MASAEAGGVGLLTLAGLGIADLLLSGLTGTVVEQIFPLPDPEKDEWKTMLEVFGQVGVSLIVFYELRELILYGQPGTVFAVYLIVAQPNLRKKIRLMTNRFVQKTMDDWLVQVRSAQSKPNYVGEGEPNPTATVPVPLVRQLGGQRG